MHLLIKQRVNRKQSMNRSQAPPIKQVQQSTSVHTQWDTPSNMFCHRSDILILKMLATWLFLVVMSLGVNSVRVSLQKLTQACHFRPFLLAQWTTESSISVSLSANNWTGRKGQNWQAFVSLLEQSSKYILNEFLASSLLSGFIIIIEACLLI